VVATWRLLLTVAARRFWRIRRSAVRASQPFVRVAPAMTTIRSPTFTIRGADSSKICLFPLRKRTTILCRVVTTSFVVLRVAAIGGCHGFPQRLAITAKLAAERVAAVLGARNLGRIAPAGELETGVDLLHRFDDAALRANSPCLAPCFPLAPLAPVVAWAGVAGACARTSPLFG
jgi:hypothetical protein